MTARFVTLESQEAVWRRAAEVWEKAAQASEAQGRFPVALSGGRTPEGLYRLLAGRRDLPWEKTEIFQVDERIVPPESGENNFRMIRESLVGPLGLPAERVHPIATEGGEPAKLAAAYEETVRGTLGAWEGTPVFDLVLLGLGIDGHTASLFPGSRALEERERAVTAVPESRGRRARITLTLPVLNAARHLVFLVTGGEKAGIVRRLKSSREVGLPAARVAPEGGRMLFLLDMAANGKSS